MGWEGLVSMVNGVVWVVEFWINILCIGDIVVYNVKVNLNLGM